eukprot:Gregarina_sp_Pseudo_9__4141@NODE_428_length_2854_cov_33_925044_g405_i0_p2_GENE_NODE_428_length_2854_cov_33_925044_g405_i0NODE_428_length_2854_cov_33_925044_g405_i0_p2_ORF_typecomplete_len184_score24_46Nup35_RRM/PF05172_13/1_8e08Nup35_RRM/PF05172_13/7_7e03_NODE_428_length_2854_cov_33_925044_g405_i05971148
MESIQRRGLPRPSPPLVQPGPPDTRWIQILGFPPDMWPQVRSQIELRCGHIIEEVRHPSCNWCIVRFGLVSDANRALDLNEKQWAPGIWLYVTRLTDAQAQALSFPVNAPMMLSPGLESKGGAGSHSVPSLSPSPPKPIALPLIGEQPTYVGGSAMAGVSDQLRRFLRCALCKLYILPVISSW